MNTCEKLECSNPTDSTYCSVACANSARPKRTRKCSDGVSQCSVADCKCKEVERLCVVCGKPRSPRAKKYCSSGVCKITGERWPEREEEINLFLANELNAQGANGRDKAGLAVWARNLLLLEANMSCTQCGWNTPHPRTGVPPLEIDHIDGNRNNNYRSNVRVLCPNCHSLTDTYRSGNRGKQHILV